MKQNKNNKKRSKKKRRGKLIKHKKISIKRNNKLIKSKKNIQKGGINNNNFEVVHTIDITEFNGEVVTFGLVSCTSIFWHWEGKNYLVHTHSLQEGDPHNAYNQALGKMKELKVKNITIYVYYGTGTLNEQKFKKYCLDNNIKLIFKHYTGTTFDHIGLSANGNLIERKSKQMEEEQRQKYEENIKRQKTERNNKNAKKKEKAASFLNKVVSRTSNTKMKWLCSEIHPTSYNLLCYVHTNFTGNHIKIDKTKQPTIILDPNDLILVD